jgi:hypothetical protein
MRYIFMYIPAWRSRGSRPVAHSAIGHEAGAWLFVCVCRGRAGKGEGGGGGRGRADEWRGACVGERDSKREKE